MGDTTISWTDKVWNVTRGCRRVSAGCEHCYAERQANRFRGAGQPYEGLIQLVGGKPRWSGKGVFASEHLGDPLRWRTPCRVFVDSMSDLFFDAFTNEEIAAVFGVMAAAKQHTFQILTKRPQRAREWFAWIAAQPTGLHAIPFSPRLVCRLHADKIINPDMSRRPLGTESDPRSWPLPNVWLGVSVENQDAADERIPELLALPAAVRFLSCEPLLGPVDLTRIGACRGEPLSALDEIVGHLERPPIDWIIAGCESGPGARPCKVEWLRALRDQCARARVPFFLKQAVAMLSWDRRNEPITFGSGSTGKGRVIERPYLDGAQHLAFPEVHA